MIKYGGQAIQVLYTLQPSRVQNVNNKIRWYHVVTRNACALSLIIIIVLIIKQLLPFLLQSSVVICIENERLQPVRMKTAYFNAYFSVWLRACT